MNLFRLAPADAQPAGTPGSENSSPTARPRLARHVRLAFDQTRQRPILLLPETVVVLNRTGEAILSRCDGSHTVAEIVASLGSEYRAVPAAEVERFLDRLASRRCVEL